MTVPRKTRIQLVGSTDELIRRQTEEKLRKIRRLVAAVQRNSDRRKVTGSQ
ncbi:hypothetical protein [Actinomadura sp. 3N508]|uniref:hypothetical protein n=1 Tax=Actinomadura sp. 3N508 TaxID=3375153 RepID=UPI00378F78D8